MRSSNIIFGALAILGIAFLASYFWYTSRPDPVVAQTAELASQDGPVLLIEVAGEANGTITVQLFPDVAGQHVDRLATLASSGAYDDVVFHRVIDGFMAQSGDVEFGKAGGDTSRAGQGGSDLPDLPAEFSDISFAKGVVGMARSNSPDSANSQFFIMFAPAPHLNGQYTVVGQVIDGIDVLDAIKRGTGSNGEVVGAPDVMSRVTLQE